MNNSNLEGRSALKKHKVGKWGVVFMIYCLVAAGAFGIEEMISSSGPGLTLLMLIVFPIFWAYPISEMIAELGSVLPSEGGPYVWTKKALGEFWGWQVGFWETMAIWLCQAAYVVLVVGYLGKFFAMTDAQAYAVKIGMIVIFTVVNLMGIKEVSKISTVLSLLVLAGFTAVALVGFTHWQYNPVTPFLNEDEGLIGSIGGSICIAIWMYCGYEAMSNCAEEIEEPQNIPKGLIMAMPLIALSYFLPTLAGLASTGNWENWGTEGNSTGYMDVLINNVGPWAGMAFLVIAILSQCSIFNAYIASGSRGFFVMADDKLFPKFLVKVSKNKGVPHVSIIVMAIITIILCQWDFQTLIMATTPLLLYLYIVLAIVTHRLRKIYPVEERKAKGLWVIPGGKVGLWFCTALPILIALIALYVNGTEYFLSGYVLIFIGLIGYIICKLAYGGLVKLDPENHPINLKTRLAVGDITRIGIFTIMIGASALLGRVLLAWYEGEWGAEYYLEEYGSGLFSDFYGMLNILLGLGIAASVAGIIIVLIGKKVEPKV